MNLAEVVQGINHVVLEAAIASSTALVLMLLLRRRLRAMFGASVAYAGWLLVPVASIAVLLPAAAPDTSMIPIVHGVVALPMQVVFAGAEPGIRYAQWLCAAWLLGAMFTAFHFMRQQRRFRATLGRLQAREAGLHQADAVAGLPAAIGWLKPLIVLPADFDTRYSVEQRGLMLAHERAHIRHGDLQANAAFLVLRCLFWFNPLIHFAARAFRHDQELACDQRVIARHPASRRAYGEAMFRTQLATQALPLGCHWGFTHPLKERIEMLKTSSLCRARRVFGASCLTVSVLLVGATAWAAQPTGQPTSKLNSDAVAVRGIGMPAPAYPKDALAQGIDRITVLFVDIAADGTVTNAVVDRSSLNSNLDAAALKAVKNWRFTPAMRDGKAISSRIKVPVEFRSDGGPDAKKNQSPPA